jgi:putative DNA primase/helicase
MTRTTRSDGQPLLMLTAALDYASRGIPVFPCNSRKRPLTVHGFVDATTDETQIEFWWRPRPRALVGMPTGSVSGIDVLDIDVKNGVNGYAALPDWRGMSNLIVATPSGGAHLYFRSNGSTRNSVGELAPGLDVRGEGGYVIVPPSVIGDGGYEFVRGDLDVLDELAPWPENLRRRLEESRLTPAVPAARAGQTSSAAMLELEEACPNLMDAPHGERNNTLNKLAFLMGQLVGAGRLDETMARERLGGAARSAGLDEDEIEATINSGITSGRSQPRLPTIKVVGGSIADNIELSEAELIASGAPIFQRGLSLVKPIKHELPAADNTKTEMMILRELQVENMIYHLNRDAAVFKRYDARSKKFVEINPPRDMAAGLLKKATWQFRQAAGVITAPTMKPDGSVLDQPGYDGATKLYFSPDRHLIMPTIDGSPSRSDAEAALTLLRELISQFPFETPLDEAVALAGLMTPVLRGAFSVAPMFLMLAHVAGSGKSHLVNLASTIATGRPCPVITMAASSGEMEKRLGAMILEGAPIISLDNCSNDLEGDLLCQITEQPIVRIRILGKSETPQCEWRGTLFATGNNISLRGDLTRRGLVCNLDAGVERPELRSFPFDPVKRAAAQRGDYIHAILTIARAWRVSGSANLCGPLGSYGQWSDTVRAALVWLGCDDPVRSMESAREDDPVRHAARGLVALWQQHLQVGTPYTAVEIINAAEEMQGYVHFETYARPDLRAFLILHAGARG